MKLTILGNRKLTGRRHARHFTGQLGLVMTEPLSYQAAALEDRCAPRISLLVPAMLRMSGGHGFAVLLTDLSVAGFACEMMTGMHPGTLCWLTLPGLAGLESRIVWNNGQKVGCEFAQLLGEAVLDWIIECHGTPAAACPA